VVEDTDLEKFVLALAQRLAAYPPTGMKNIKRSFNMALESSSPLHLHSKRNMTPLATGARDAAGA